MANNIAGIKDAIKTILESVSGVDKVYEYGLKEITATTCIDIWWDGVEEFIPETTHTMKVGWRFDLNVYIKIQDRKAADLKLATLGNAIYAAFLEKPDLDLPDYVDNHILRPSTNGISVGFKQPVITTTIPMIVYTEETRTG